MGWVKDAPDDEDVLQEETIVKSQKPQLAIPRIFKMRDNLWKSCNSMWASLRLRNLLSPSSAILHQWKLGFPRMISQRALLDLQEVEKVLADVRADDVRVVPVKNGCDWADYMVFATGRSTWHVRNIAQALIYKVKQKHKEEQNQRLILPRVEGQEEGKWVIVDSGNVVVHALDEKARAYYDLEGLWSKGTAPKESEQELEKAFVKVRRKNNSKKPAQPRV